MRKIIALGAALAMVATAAVADTGIGKGHPVGVGGSASPPPPPPPPPASPPPTGTPPGKSVDNTGIGKGNPHASVVHCRVTDVSAHSFTCRAHGKTYVFHVTHNRTLRHIKVGRHVRVTMHFHHHRHYADRVTVLR